MSRTRVERRSWVRCVCGRLFLGYGPLHRHQNGCTDHKEAENHG